MGMNRTVSFEILQVVPQSKLEQQDAPPNQRQRPQTPRPGPPPLPTGLLRPAPWLQRQRPWA